MEHTIFEAIGLDDFLRLVDDVRHVDLRNNSAHSPIHRECTYPNNVFGSGLRSEHTQDARSAPDVQHSLAFE